VTDDSTTDDEGWDVIVVGAGPAGSAAARAAAERGARVLLVDAAAFPRYKTCGGGLIGASLAELPAEALATIERRISTVSIALQGGRAHRIRSSTPFLAMTNREAFDAALVDAAKSAGATFRDHVRVRAIESDADGVRLRADTGELRAAVVIGADGSAGVCGRHVGVRMTEQDLGLEVELAGTGAEWAERMHLDWGTERGTYGWVFPKADHLTVGVIQRKGEGAATRAYLDRFVAELGLDARPVLRSSGHLTQWRTPDSPLRRGRVLVAGDAAGLLEPWTREGISFALRSGRIAGEVAALGDVAQLEQYDRAIARTLGPEQRAGALMLRAFERHPRLIDFAFRTGGGATAFVRFCRGTLTLQRIVGHRALRLPVRVAARVPR
jgi:geranylgeranyl reductase family protein